MLQIDGQVNFATPWAATRNITVTARVFGTGDFPLALDSTGHYRGQVGPLPAGLADSLLVLIGEGTCSRNYYVSVWRYQVRIADGPLTLPPQDLLPTGSPFPLQAGAQFCGWLPHGFMDEGVQLLLTIDSLTPTLYGTYRAMHRVSCADQHGTFVAPRTPSPLTLTLASDAGEVPLHLTVSLPFAPDSLVSLATVMGLDTTAPCFIPSGTTYLYPY